MRRTSATRNVLALALTLVVALTLAACGHREQAGVRYQCPMHPTYVSDRPGDCPICGMKLVPIEQKIAPEAADRGQESGNRGQGSGDRATTQPSVPHPSADDNVAAYTCPMHPEVVSDNPGRCPKCGMELVAVGAGDLDQGSGNRATARTSIPHPTPEGMETAGSRTPNSGGGREVLFYRNPMDPSVTSPVPKKDSMGMDYVPVYAGEAAPAAASVPGLAEVRVSAEGLRLAGVQTAPVVRGTLARTIRTVGTVTADESLVRHIHTRFSGWVEKLLVNFTGQFVKLGDPILTLYSPELMASQEEFLAARDSAAKFAASSIPEVRKGGQDLLNAARQRLELLDAPISAMPQRDVTLFAPVTGYVTAKNVFEGHEVQPGVELYTITDLSRVWIEADFYESEASVLRLGQDARLSLPYDPRVRLAGKIAYIYPTLDPATRTLRVRFEFDNPKLTLKPGMFADVEVRVGPHRTLVIPDSAVIDTGERRVVFVSLGDGRFQPREVRVGTRSTGSVEVLSGLREGEQVVVRANFLIDSESRLQAALASAGPPPSQGTGTRAQGTAEKNP